MDNEKRSFDSASTITDGKAIPVPTAAPQSLFKRLALQIFPKTGSGSGRSNCFTGLSTNSSSQTLANKLATLDSAQEKDSEAANVTVGFKLDAVQARLPLEGYYAIQTTSKGYYLMRKEMVNQRSIPLFDMIFGKDSLRDISAVPAATLADYDNFTLGIFVLWIRNRDSRSMIYDHLFEEKVCTREDRVETLDLMMKLLFFADRYSLHEFQDDLLELFIEISKEDSSPLDTVHVLKFHNQLSRNSKIRAFLIDIVAFTIKEIEDSRKYRRKAALNCDLSFNKRESLVELRRLLHGGKIPFPYRKLSDPRDAPSCYYHHHGREEECPHKTVPSSLVSETCREKA
ncbi:hypothetical protein ACHAPC_009293 [Botrytis cinerea]